MKTEIISQYRASLEMLTRAINRCPEDLWNNGEHINVFWRIVFHTLHYTDLYLSGSPEKFNPWRKYISNYHVLGSRTFDDKPVSISEVYTSEDMLEYADLIHIKCEDALNAKGLEEESGFEWLPMNRFELHLYNLRHLHHHIGQLVEQLHSAGIVGIGWVRSGK